MRDHETAMCAYAQLAVLSHEKRQSPARDRFLLLTGVEACRAGWPEVAAACHGTLVQNRSPMQVTKFPSFEEALRDEEFSRIAAHWERWCPFERAEHLLQRLGNSPRSEAAGESAGAWVLQLLQALASVT
uniref:Uncharacterized protein n=1 Tax=Schlesneria paludicola TaxID=360056 RepID=A0A7C2PIT7_9PLAN